VVKVAKMAKAVAAYMARAAEKFRRKALATTNIVVFVETSRFRRMIPDI